MIQPARKYSATDSYRYGFNGKEKSDEISNDNYDFGARIYDSRIGRWLSLDPLQKKYPGESNYIFTSDNPILYRDIDGRDKIITITIIQRDGQTTQIQMKDENYFKYHRDKTYSGGYDCWKANVYENIILDYSQGGDKATIMKSTSETRAADVSWWSTWKISDILSGDWSNSDKISYGYRIYGKGRDTEWQRGLPTAAAGVESIDLGDWFDLLSGFSPNEEGVYESVSKVFKKIGGLKGKDFEQVKIALDMIVGKTENLSEAAVKAIELVERLKKEREEKEKNGKTIPTIKKPSAVYCEYCKNNYEVDSQGNATQTKTKKPASDTIKIHGQTPKQRQ